MKLTTFFFRSIAFCLLVIAFTSCQDSVRLDLSRRIEVLIKDTSLYNHILLDFDGISIYKSKAYKDLDKPECKVYYSEIETFKGLWEIYTPKEIARIYQRKGTLYFDNDIVQRVQNELQIREEGSPDKPLAGKVIAVDPAYIGGSPQMAMLEGKLLKVVRAPRDTVYLDEGALTLAVARILEVKLEKMGASVVLTRHKPGTSALGKSFFEWMKEDLKREAEHDRYVKEITEERARYLLEEASPLFIYNQFFLQKDLERRAKIINDYKPDVALMLNFNVHEPNWKRRDPNTNALRPTDKNYSLSFVSGGFMAGEMSTMWQRIEMLRLILSEDLDESLKLSEKVMTAFKYELGVEAVKADMPLEYLQKSCNPTNKKGIYARNLYLTRRIHAPLCYAQPFCLDNIEEFGRVNKAEVQVGKDITTSLRLEEVADAYIAALSAYFEVVEPLSEDDIVEQEL